MTDTRPGLNFRRLLGLMRAAIGECNLNLSGAVVLTEAASGPYVVTPILAAMAGARKVYAITRSTRHGSFEEVASLTLELARLAEADKQVQVITEKTAGILAEADIVTNSGHVRPLDSSSINRMKRTAVIPLMYEAWEFRGSDVDVEACAARGIRVAGTNERHPAVNVFSYLGMMASKLLLEAGIAVFDSNILLLCDNPFSDYINSGLKYAGARINVARDFSAAETGERLDAILVALKPGESPVIGRLEGETIRRNWPEAVVVQFWGDIDRSALSALEVACWPSQAPPTGHMGVLPSALGPEPVVRLQCGGLKVGEVLLRSASQQASDGSMFLDELLPA